MANNRKPLKKRNLNHLTIRGEPGEAASITCARAVLDPSVQAAVTLQGYGQTYGDLELDGLVASLKEQTRASGEGDLGRAEAMLTAQAHTLDAIFNHLAQGAVTSNSARILDRYLKLGLRAQAQCRAPWEALAALKRPPTLGYVQQANIAHGPQQVNNVPDVPDAPSRGRNPMLQNKLLETNDGERLDPGTAIASGRADPALVTVGTIDRPEDRGR